MHGSSNDDAFWEALAGVLIRCFAMGMVFLLVWFVGFLAAGGWAFSIHSRWFLISPQAFHLLNYGGMFLWKLAIFGFFLIPCLAIRWTLAAKRRGG